MTLLQMSFYGAVLIVVVLLLRALFRNKLPKKMFLVLWGIVLLRLLVPFEVQSVLSIYSLLPDAVVENIQLSDTQDFVGRDLQDSSENTGTASGLTTNTGAVSNVPASNPLQGGMPDNLAGETQGKAEQPVISALPDEEEKGSLLIWLQDREISGWFVLWCVGACICGGLFLVAYVRCLREFRTSLPVQNKYVEQWLEEHLITREITVRQSDRISTPLTYGLLRPVILLPKKVEWEDEQQLQYILTHEFIHICHFDMFTKLIAVAALCIHWFNPLVWLMYFYLNRDIELACDEAVVQRLGDSSERNYAYTLIHMAEKANGMLSFYNSFSKNALEERITSLAKRKRNTRRIAVAAVLIIVVVAAVFATSARREQENNEGTQQVEESPKPTIEATEAPTEMPSEAPTEAPTGPPAATPAVTPETLPAPISVENHEIAEEVHLNYEVTLTFMTEGEEEQTTALLCADSFGNQTCYFYLPDGEWLRYDTDEWYAAMNEKVHFGVNRFEGLSYGQVKEQFAMDGYTEGSAEGLLEKLSGDIVYKVWLREIQGYVWEVYYYYPVEAEEGWGSRLPVIADTFAVKTWEQWLLSEEEYLGLISVLQSEKDWFADYNGEKLQHILKGEGDPGDISDIVYYQADEGEELQEIVQKMFSAMMEPLKETSENRAFTIKDYYLGRQRLLSEKELPDILPENAWFIPSIWGWWDFEGMHIGGTMENYKSMERTSSILNGMVPFYLQGSESVFNYLLLKEGDVYRLQRIPDMLTEE